MIYASVRNELKKKTDREIDMRPNPLAQAIEARELEQTINQFLHGLPEREVSANEVKREPAANSGKRSP